MQVALGFLILMHFIVMDYCRWQSLTSASRVTFDGENVDERHYKGPDEVKLQACFGDVERTPKGLDQVMAQAEI